MLQAYQDLLSFYKQSDVAKSDNNFSYIDSNILCFKKILDNQNLIVLVNIREQAVNYSLPSDLKNTSWTNALTGGNIQLSSQITLSPYDYLILE